MQLQYTIGLLLAATAQVLGQSPKQDDLKTAVVDSSGKTETTDFGTPDNTTNSLRAGPRGYVLLEDTIARKKIFHFDHERQPERVVHALGHGAYGTFESSGDWSNLTSACWLKQGVQTDAFTRFSVVVAGVGGSDTGRDTHGFATKLYSECGNQDLVGNHLPSFFINDGILFPDLIHAVKAEPDKGFPTGGTAHDTAYDFFTQRPEGAFQLMNVLSDLGIPRDTRHIGGAGVHTFRFINAEGKSTLFKWYWSPKLGHRSLVYDEATKIAGKNGNFHRVDLYNNIAAGLYPEWDFLVQTFPDDGNYEYKGIDLLDPTKVVPFELNPPLNLGKLTLNRNPTNYFAETESISFAPSNVVNGITFVPDPLLQWRLISYDDTANHRHGSPNHYLLPINRAIAPVNNNYRDGNMQPLLFSGASASSPNGLDGVVAANTSDSLAYSGSPAEKVEGDIGRYAVFNDFFGQARAFWASLDKYAQQHTVDAYRFELGHVVSKGVQANYVNEILDNIDNCLARRVAFGIGAPLPPLRNISTSNTSTFTSLYPLAASLEPNKSLDGLSIAILVPASPSISANVAQTITGIISAVLKRKVLYEVIADHQGVLSSAGDPIVANSSYITTSSVFYDAILVVEEGTANCTASRSASAPPTMLDFLREAYGHGKPIASISSASATCGNSTKSLIAQLGYASSSELGIFSTTEQVLNALAGPVRFPARLAVDDEGICA